MKFSIYLLLMLSLKVNSFNDDKFWITGNVKSVEWKKNCLTIDRCLQPRFQIAFYVADNSIASRVDSPVIERLSIKNKMPINAYFENASPNDLSVTASVFGVDSLFNVPVVCDKSNYIDVFPSLTTDSEVTEIILEGNCFKANVEVGKHQQKCPWCPDETESKNENESSIFDSFLLSPNQRGYTIVLLIVVLMFFLLAMVLVLIIIKQRRPNGEFLNKYSYTNTTTRSTLTPGTPTSHSSDVTNGIFYDVENPPIRGQKFTELDASGLIRPPPISTIPSVKSTLSEYHEYSSITAGDLQQSKSSFLNSWKINRQPKQKDYIPKEYMYI